MVLDPAAIVTVIKFTEIIFGITLNAFIVAINVVWWLRSRTVQTLDLIVSTLGLIRFFHLMIAVLTLSPLFLKSLHQNERANRTFLMAQTFMNNYSLWTGTFLCLFYCVKITSYNHRLFIYLKLNISRLIPTFFVASLVISLINILPIEWFVYEGRNVTSSNVSSASYKGRVSAEINVINLFIISIAGSALPLLIFCPSIYLLISSLWSHLRHMKNMDCGSSRPQLDAHINAVRNMLSFLILYLGFFGSSCLMPVCLKSGRRVWIEFCLVITYAYPALHSVVLIWSHRQMNQLIQRVVQWATGKQNTLPGENESNTT